MPSINPERRGVNYQDVFAASLDRVRVRVTQQLGQEVEARMSMAITGMLQRAPVTSRAIMYQRFAPEVYQGFAARVYRRFAATLYHRFAAKLYQPIRGRLGPRVSF